MRNIFDETDVRNLERLGSARCNPPAGISLREFLQKQPGSMLTSYTLTFIRVAAYARRKAGFWRGQAGWVRDQSVPGLFEFPQVLTVACFCAALLVISRAEGLRGASERILKPARIRRGAPSFRQGLRPAVMIGLLAGDDVLLSLYTGRH